MKSKKMASALLACVMMAGCAVIPVVSVSAETDDSSAVQIIETVKTYTNRAGFVSDVDNGEYTVTDKTGEDNWQTIYKMTLADDANVMLYYAFSNFAQYYDWQYSLELYSDIYLSKKIDLSATTINLNSLYAYLKKGTYYIKISKSFSNAETLYFFAGQISKNAKFGSVEYVKANDDQTITYKVANPMDEVGSASVLICNYGKTDASATSSIGSSVKLDKKFQFKISYGKHSDDAYLNIVYTDVYGYKYKDFALCLTKYTANISGIKNKTYTGKDIKQSGVTVKAGYANPAYRVSYKNNKKVGTATVTFKGSGETIGSVSKTFTILPSKIKSFSGKVKGKKVTLKWGKSLGASVYTLQKYNGKKWKNILITKKNSAKIAVSKGTTKFRIYGSATSNNKVYSSSKVSLKVKRK